MIERLSFQVEGGRCPPYSDNRVWSGNLARFRASCWV